MAMVDIEIGSRRYSVACRDGEEASLQAAAALVDQKVREAIKGLGPMSEARQLLFASLMLADAVQDRGPARSPEPRATDPGIIAALNGLADRMESLAARLEDGIATS